MLFCALKRGFASLTVGGLLWAWGACADPVDPLGAVGRYYLPIPAPSTDTSPRTFFMNGQTYIVPRNYVESLSKNDDGTVSVISIRALLPDFTGLTKDTIRCGLNYSDPCSSRVVVIDLAQGPFPTSGVQQLSNAKGISHPDEREGPCGFKYYESFGSAEKGGVVFQFFFARLADTSDLSFLRCAKPGSAFAKRCNARDNVGDGNSFYYNFDRGKLCEWSAIRSSSLSLINSFRKGAKHE